MSGYITAEVGGGGGVGGRVRIRGGWLCLSIILCINHPVTD